MKLIETVDLPSVDEQPLVHPLDIPEARKDFRRAYWTRSFTSPGVALVVAAILWFYVDTWVFPVLAFLSLAIIGYFAAAWSDREAWGFIPRKRRDLDRPLPFWWELASAVILASLLSVGALLIGTRFTRVSSDIHDYVLGAAIAIAGMCVVVLVVRLCRTATRRAALFSIPWIVALVASISVVCVWVNDAGPNWVYPDTVLWGFIVTLATGTLAGAWKLLESYKQRRSTTSA